MSEFMLIAPEGWTQIDLMAFTSNTGLTIEALNDYEKTALYYELNTLFIELGLMPEGKEVVGTKIVNGEYFFVLFG